MLRNTNDKTSGNRSSKDSSLYEIRDTLMMIIKEYRENEADLNVNQLKPLLALAFIQDPEIFRAFLEVFLIDLSTDVLFNPEKVRMISLILISAMRNTDFPSYLQVDDLVKILKILKPMIEDLSITSKNLNIQEAMSALNDILYLMGFIGAKGIKGDYLQLISDLTKYMQTHSLEKVFNFFRSTAKDPSLEIKREYTLEALGRIESTDFEAWAQKAADYFQDAQIAVKLGKGVLMGDLSSVNEALLQITEMVAQSYMVDDTTWYDNANSLRLLEHEPMDKILKQLFGTTWNSNKNYTFFAAEFLLRLIVLPHRKLAEKKMAAQALWFLANGYDYRESRAQRTAVKSKTFEYDIDILLYVKESLKSISEKADLDFSVYILKILEGPLRIESANNQRANLAKQQATAAEKSAEEESDPGKQFYLRTLIERKPRLYAIAQIQDHCERTFKKPAVLIDFRGISKEKDCDEAFMRKVEERLEKITSTDINESLSLLASLDAKTVTKTTFYDVIDEVCSKKGVFKSEQESESRKRLLEAVKSKVEQVFKINGCDLLDTFEDFLNDSSKRVMLIQGDAGAGKTLLLRLYEHKLWKKYHVLSKADSKKRNRLPIRIVLSEVRSFNKAVDEFLFEHGCDFEGVQDIKRQPAVIFFDGYDEINQYINLYNLNNLEMWTDVKVVFTSRKENLTALKEDYLYCFTPGQDKSRVLSYSIQTIEESQSMDYFIAQMADKKNVIRKLKQALNAYNQINSTFMPISNILVRKIEFLKRLGQGQRLECLRGVVETLKDSLAEIEEVQKEIDTLGLDKEKLLPLSDIARNQIDKIRKLTDKDYIKSITDILELELLEVIQEAEKSLKNAKQEQCIEKSLAYTSNKDFYFQPARVYKKPPWSMVTSIKDLMKGSKQSIGLKGIYVALEKIVSTTKGISSHCYQQIHSMKVDPTSKSSFEELMEETSPGNFKAVLNTAKQHIQPVTDFIKILKEIYPDVFEEHKNSLDILKPLCSSIISRIENFTDFERLEAPITKMGDILQECFAPENEIYSLLLGGDNPISPMDNKDKSYEDRRIDVIKVKALYLEIEAKVGQIRNMVKEIQSSFLQFVPEENLPPEQGFEILLTKIKLEHRPQYEAFIRAYRQICGMCSHYSNMSFAVLRCYRKYETVVYKTRDLCHLKELYNPLKTLQERVNQAQQARKEIKILKSFSREGSNIVQALKQQTTFIRSLDPKKAEPIIQKLEHLVQEIATPENEFNEIRDDFTEESAKIKSLKKEIQGLTKFTDPMRIGPVIEKFKDIIKSPFILIMLTETLVKYPDSSSNKSELYRLFVNLHFEREKDKLLQTEKVPSKFNIIDSFYQYSKDLAVNMFIRNVVSLRAKDYGYKMGRVQPQAENFWSGFFDSEKDTITRLARRGAQIIEEDGVVRFVHKSILEYFVARGFYDEIVEFNPENLEDFAPYLNKRSIATNGETTIYQFIRDTLESESEKKQDKKSLSVFEKKLVQMMSNLSLYKKYENFEENWLYPNLFLLWLACQNSNTMVLLGKESPAFPTIITKIFEWLSSYSEASVSILKIIPTYKNHDLSDLRKRLDPLKMLYFDQASRQESGPQFKDQFVTAKRNIQIKIQLEEPIPGSAHDPEPMYVLVLDGKFFIHDSKNSIVVLRTEDSGRYLAVDLKALKRPDNQSSANESRFPVVLHDIKTPWEALECKWNLTFTSRSTFKLESLADPSVTLNGLGNCRQLLDGICFFDVCNLKQHHAWYKCITCDLQAFYTYCESCVEHCHKGHNLITHSGHLDYCECRKMKSCKVARLCAEDSFGAHINSWS